MLNLITVNMVNNHEGSNTYEQRTTPQRDSSKINLP